MYIVAILAQILSLYNYSCLVYMTAAFNCIIIIIIYSYTACYVDYMHTDFT